MKQIDKELTKTIFRLAQVKERAEQLKGHIKDLQDPEQAVSRFTIAFVWLGGELHRENPPEDIHIVLKLKDDRKIERFRPVLAEIFTEELQELRKEYKELKDKVTKSEEEL